MNAAANFEDRSLAAADPASPTDAVAKLPEPMNPGDLEPRVQRLHSVVVPVYKNAPTLPALIQALTNMAARLHGSTEVVFVVDGSPDDSLAVLETLAPESPLSIQIVEHSRNFGSFAAIRTGLEMARGDYIGVVAADLQEPPELLEKFMEVLSSGQADVVVGRRDARHDPAGSSLAARMYWGMYRRFVLPELPPGGVDVFALTREAARDLLRLEESGTSLVAQLYWIGYRRAEVGYTRAERTEGKSGWTFRKKLDYMADSVFAFTSWPIRILTWLGGVGLAVTIALSGVVLGAWLMGRIPEPGYTPLMLVLLGCTFLLVLSLGIVGSYVWRTYENTKRRPISLVSRRQVFGQGD